MALTDKQRGVIKGVITGAIMIYLAEKTGMLL